jgi:hypothetical protein
MATRTPLLVTDEQVVIPSRLYQHKSKTLTCSIYALSPAVLQDYGSSNYCVSSIETMKEENGRLGSQLPIWGIV